MRTRNMSSPTDNRTTIHRAATKLFQLPLVYCKDLNALASLRQREGGGGGPDLGTVLAVTLYKRYIPITFSIADLGI
jgi:hypothetical protein